MKKLIYLVLLPLLCFFVACDDKETTEEVIEKDPVFLFSLPADGTQDVLLTNEVTVVYNTPIKLAENAVITVNGNAVTTTISDRKLTLGLELAINQTYQVSIPANAITNVNGKGAAAVSFTFSTVSDSKTYEAENALLSGNAAIENSIQGFLGTGYVNQKDGDITFKVAVPTQGLYTLNIRYSNGNEKKENDLVVNGTQLATLTFDPTSDWKILSINKLKLNAGENTIVIKKNWGWMYYDYIAIAPKTTDTPFNIAASLINPAPSPEAVKVYNFLKENFGNKVISGAMANYSTGLEEATWMHDQTTRWPALTGFDFIDYTRTWSNINFTALVDNSKDWWKNNGLVTLMWHWRDPSRKTDQFYTEGTTFDVSKINTVDSDEYKAMIADIDIVAGYLKQLKDANVPILWRPLHEASGGWFWWGAKGPQACKDLWKLMYERLVNHHGLNNLIWVWTTDAADNAMDWYPGDEYVDILGLDIYPGENQHGSQYITFDRVKAMYQGKKIITLSECGSIPAVDAMFEYGDTWSWVMPWNGDYTRSDKHNGSAYINAFFNNTKVLTRDQIPSLK